jgi:hypothetical protein
MPERKLPSGKIVEFVGLKGRDERKLLNDIQARKVSAFDELMRSCTRSIDRIAVESMDAILDLHSGDRLALLLFLRAETYGERVSFDWTCPRCSQKTPVEASLGDIDYERPLVLDVGPAQLPRAQKNATWALPTGHTEALLAKLRRGAKTIDTTHLLLSRSVAIEARVANERELDDLEAADRALLHEKLRRNGGPDSAIECPCGACGHVGLTRFEVLPDFFFPAVARA